MFDVLNNNNNKHLTTLNTQSHRVVSGYIICANLQLKFFTLYTFFLFSLIIIIQYTITLIKFSRLNG